MDNFVWRQQIFHFSLFTFTFYIWYAMAYFHRDGFHFEAVLAYLQTHHAGLAVQRLVLVEDEVAHAVIDLVAAIVLDSLEGVGVVAHEHIGTRQHEHVGIVTLTENGLQLMLLPPME